ncbi:MAG TPA: tetraacyldisaccharide 4'-kinase [Planctomycetota bacterium]|jgi:tetraacyldisaccharide 4'-kinase
MAESSSSSSLLPPALRWAGPLLAAGYGLGSRLHRAFSSPKPSPLPTICIGNITVGGTGKTPATKYFARGLAQRGRKPAVLQRGYKDQANDEAVEIRTALQDLRVPVLIEADRLASAQRAKADGRDVALLDDGFQHWRLARDLDIVLIDATNPFGGGHLAPWGRLREKPEALARAGIVILTRADQVSPDRLAEIEKEIAAYAPQAVKAKAVHKPVALRNCVHGDAIALEKLKGLPVYALCGIGNPDAFLRTLESLGVVPAGNACYSDHAALDAWQMDFLDIPCAEASGAKAIVLTEKDAAKLATQLAGVTFPVWALEVQFRIIDGEQAVWQKIEEVLPAGSSRLST